MTNEELVLRIKAGEDVRENMEQLYFQVLPFIRSMAWKYKGQAEIEDLEQEGYLALYPAIDAYDMARGVKFLTCAEKWIRQRMRRYIQNNRSCLRLPVHSLEKVKQYQQFVSAYVLEYGQEPTSEVAAKGLGWMWETVVDVRKSAELMTTLSLDVPLRDADGAEDTAWKDMLADEADPAEEILGKMQEEQLSTTLWGMVDELPGELPEMVRRRFQEEQSYKQIGEAMGGKAAEAARSGINKGLRELRKPSKIKRLRPFLPEDERIYSAGLVCGGLAYFEQTWTSSTERAALKL